MLNLRNVFNKYKEFEGAEVYLNKNVNNPYLHGKVGYISRFVNANAVAIRVLLEEYDEEQEEYRRSYSTMTFTTKQFFLANPEDYPTLSHLPVDPKKRGGGNVMGNMPRLFQFFVYGAIVWFVWHVVANIDSIAQFFVHLLLHR